MKAIKNVLFLIFSTVLLSASCEKINDEPNFDNRLLGNWELESITDQNGNETTTDFRLEFTSEVHANGYRGVRMIDNGNPMYCYYRQNSAGLELTENLSDNGANARDYDLPDPTVLRIFTNDNSIEKYLKVP